ncbi:hypothetical protein [Streptomyces niveus]|uniref:hypothetical protein n=1 Tax=Streptomyces niveus TaxID=193462 RepID=UPI003410C19E
MQSSQRRIVRTAPLPVADETVSRPQHSDLFLEAQYTVELPPIEDEPDFDGSAVPDPGAYRGGRPHVGG